MSKREKIIIVITLVTALYGVYTLLLATPSADLDGDPGKRLQELTRFTTDVANSLTQDTQAESMNYILARASAAWPAKPFLKSGLFVNSDKPQNQEERPVVAAAAIDFSYSGYLEMADRRLAIINGIEYEAGDELVQLGYIVRSISPIRVLIEAAGDGDRIILPLEESY